MSEYPLVSILIPLYNAEQYFSETVESLLAQTYTNLEIIIVDDGSTDNSLKIVREYEKQYKHIKVYTQENSGAQVARNKAFKMSQGEYIQYFDADDIMHPDKIYFQIEALRKYDFDTDVVTTGNWVRFYQTIDNLRFKRRILDRNYDDTISFLKDSWENREFIIGQAWLISRKLNEKVGNWDIKVMKNQDGEFFTRVVYASTKIIYSKNSLVYWRQDNQNSLSKNTSYQGLKSELLVLNSYFNIVSKNMDYPDLRKALVIFYSRILLKTYPRYKDLSNVIILKIKQLGYSKPVYKNRYKLTQGIDLLGYKVAIYILNLYKKSNHD